MDLGDDDFRREKRKCSTAGTAGTGADSSSDGKINASEARSASGVVRIRMIVHE